jgi:hypothetical protein
MASCCVTYQYNVWQHFCSQHNFSTVFLNKSEDMFQASPSGHLQVHMHKYIKEKLKHVHDFDYVSIGNTNLIFILHCQYISYIKLYKSTYHHKCWNSAE